MMWKISPASPRDRPALLALAHEVDERCIYPTLSRAGQATLAAHRENDIDLLFEDNAYQTLKAQIDDRILAYIAWRDGYYISHLYVACEFQRQGIGRRLLDAMRSRATRLPLQLKSSINAVEFYQRYGFVAVQPVQTIKDIRFVPMEFHPATQNPDHLSGNTPK